MTDQHQLLEGRHLVELANTLAVTDREAAALTGYTINGYYKASADGTRRQRNKNLITAAKPKEEMKGFEPLIPRQAILVRLLLNHPDFFLKADFDVLHEFVMATDPSVTRSHMAIMLGLEPSAAIRVENGNKKLSPSVSQLINIIYINMLIASNDKERQEIIDALRKNVNAEAAARGIPYGEIWLKGGFTKLATHPRLKGLGSRVKAKKN